MDISYWKKDCYICRWKRIDTRPTIRSLVTFISFRLGNRASPKNNLSVNKIHASRITQSFLTKCICVLMIGIMQIDQEELDFSLRLCLSFTVSILKIHEDKREFLCSKLIKAFLSAKNTWNKILHAVRATSRYEYR